MSKENTNRVTSGKKDNQLNRIDYKDVNILRSFLNPHGRILNRKRTHLSAKQQRNMDTSVKRARFMGLLPFIDR